MVFMSLNVCSELKLAVFCAVNLGANHNCTWTESGGDSVAGQETVEPKSTQVNHLCNHACRHLLEW